MYCPTSRLKNTSLFKASIQRVQNLEGFLKTSRGVTTVPVCSNTHLSIRLVYTCMVFLDYQSVCPGCAHVTYRDFFCSSLSS